MSLVDVVWMDREHAKLFSVGADLMEMKNLGAHHVEHHTHVLDSKDRSLLERKLFRGLVDALGKSKEGAILIIGPGVAKYHFFTYLREEHPELSRRVAGCDTVDHPTDHQIAAIARNYLNKTVAAPASG